MHVYLLGVVLFFHSISQILFVLSLRFLNSVCNTMRSVQLISKKLVRCSIQAVQDSLDAASKEESFSKKFAPVETCGRP
jgi:hypothetical protein